MRASLCIFRSKLGPIVYRLGRILLKDESRVRFPVGSQIAKSAKRVFSILDF